MPYVYYTGLGAARESGFHSVPEFMQIMQSNAEPFYRISTAQGFNMEYKGFQLPGDFNRFTLADWVAYTGADYYDSSWEFDE
jgi:hypothetical protein